MDYRVLTIFNISEEGLEKLPLTFFSECNNDYIIFCNGVVSSKHGILTDISPVGNASFQTFLNDIRSHSILDNYDYVSLYDLTKGAPNLELHNISSNMLDGKGMYFTLVNNMYDNTLYNGVLLSTNYVNTINTVTLDEAYRNNMFSINGSFINIEHFKNIEHATNVGSAWGYNYILKYLSTYNTISLIPKVTFYLYNTEEYNDEFVALAKDTYNGINKKRKNLIKELK